MKEGGRGRGVMMRKKKLSSRIGRGVNYKVYKEKEEKWMKKTLRKET